MSAWITEAGLAWRPLQPFGAEVDHDLSRPLTEAQGRRLVQLLWRRGLVLARGQNLTMAQQEAVCGFAGPILHREGENGYLTAVAGVAATLTELSWHADAAYTRAPLDAISLHALEVVDEASSTRFVNAQDAWDALPADLRAQLADRELDMISPAFEALGARSCDQEDPVVVVRGVFPAVRRNPHNGRQVLWTSELQTARVLGLDWAQSRDLLHAVFDHLYRPARVLEHRWRNGDLVIWDNVGLQHMRGPLRDVGVRVLQRVIVGTEGVAPHVRQASAA
jgi:taurine dioxygenase